MLSLQLGKNDSIEVHQLQSAPRIDDESTYFVLPVSLEDAHTAEVVYVLIGVEVDIVESAEDLPLHLYGLALEDELEDTVLETLPAVVLLQQLLEGQLLVSLLELEVLLGGLC